MTSNASWQSLPLDAPGPPPPELDRTGAVALVSCGDRSWSASAALALARSLARGGRRVFLCDLELSSPRLHTVAEVTRDEGVTDFILYGASPGHVARELEDRLLFVSAGTPCVAFETVYDSDRWSGLLEAATHARACLLMLVPADVRGSEAILRRVGTIVGLGSPDQVPERAAAMGLHFGFKPVDETGGDRPDSATAGDVADVDPAPPGVAAADLPRVEPSAAWTLDPAATGPDPDDAPEMSLATATAMNRAARKSKPRSNRLGLWLFLLFIVLLAILLAGWYGIIDVPGIAPRRADAREGAPGAGVREASTGAVSGEGSARAGESSPESDPGTGAGVPPAADPTAVSAPLQEWVLRLGAFSRHSVAVEQAALMSTRAPDHLFVVAPVDVGGARWYRVLSALAEDEAGAERARSDLAGSLAEPNADEWLARRAPWAFLLSEVPTVTEAHARVGELEAEGIDAYVLQASRPDGSRVMRVYAGAYADADEAAALRSVLQAHGIAQPRLVERRGIRPE